jgi:hypothetical protein
MIDQMTFNFVSAETKPEENKPILLKYLKIRKNYKVYSGKTGEFLTQGYYDKRGDVDYWWDYTDRLITSSGGVKNSSKRNKIIEWAYIVE